MSYLNIILFLLLLYWLVVVFLDKRGKLSKYNITVYYFIVPILMFRTSKGQEFLDKLAVHKRFWRLFANTGIPLMLIGMFVMLLITLLPIIISVRTQTLPPPSKFSEPQNILLIPGINEFFPLAWGIIALSVTLVVHEFAHAVLCKVEGIKVKSMGILLALIPIGGFAEPDEEQLLGTKYKDEKEITVQEPKKLATRSERMRVLTAGVMANFVTATIAFIFFFSFLGSLSPIGEVMVATVVPGSPADLAGIKQNMVLTGINEIQINNTNDFLLYVRALELGSNVTFNLFDHGVKKQINLVTVASNETLAGVRVFGVVEGSPAASAGIKQDMILVRIDDTEIRGVEDFIAFMNSTQEGQKVDVYFMSNSSANSSLEAFRNIELAKNPNTKKGFLGISYSPENGAISYSVGMGVGQFPARDYLHGLKSIPSSLTRFIGWGSLLGLPFFDIEGKMFPRFTMDLLTYFYEPAGWAAQLGAGIFLVLNIFLWIGWTNLLAGLFNCLPAVPLDGGHVFRDVTASLLSRVIGNGEKVESISDAIVVIFAVMILMLLAFMIVGPYLTQWL